MIICPTCNKEVEAKVSDQTFSNGTTHRRADCPDCGRWLKYLTTDFEPTLHFGKYKGRTYREVAEDERSYLEWLARDGRDAKVREFAKAALGIKD